MRGMVLDYAGRVRVRARVRVRVRVSVRMRGTELDYAGSALRCQDARVSLGHWVIGQWVNGSVGQRGVVVRMGMTHQAMPLLCDLCYPMAPARNRKINPNRICTAPYDGSHSRHNHTMVWRAKPCQG